MNRRSLPSTPPIGVHATRRQEARTEASQRVTLSHEGRDQTGWTLNMSGGGVRIVLEGSVDPGHEAELLFDGEELAREVQVIWVQDEADGQIVGIKFLDVEGSVPPPPPPGLE